MRSDAFVFFGATGDLAYKKIFPALQSMIRRGHLDAPIIGVAKQGWNLEQLRERARDSVREHGGLDDDAFARLSANLHYVDGDYQDGATFEALRKALGEAQRPIHYLAIPPSLFPVVVQHLGSSGCARGARVIVEKPFGRDLRSAQALNQTLHQVFPEPAIFRIDHYLGKEAVQNLKIFRFGNSFFEPIWNRHYVESVQITMAEQFGVKGRGGFYDDTGAIRDLIQNHMMQVVGMLAMEAPATTYTEAVRDELVKVFRQVRPLDPQHLVRGQFDGYRSEKGVAPDSLGRRAVLHSRRQVPAGHHHRGDDRAQAPAAHQARLRARQLRSTAAHARRRDRARRAGQKARRSHGGRAHRALVCAPGRR